MLRLKLFVMIVLTACPGGAAESVDWIEAEDGTGAIPREAGSAPASDTERDSLSGGDWLACSVQQTGTQAAWAFSSKGGERVLWERIGIGSAAPRWRIDSGDWRDPDLDVPCLDIIPLDIRGDRYLGVGWQRLGHVLLVAGKHQLAITLGKGSTRIDCFAFLPPGRHPNGIERPDAPPPSAPRGWFTFEPPAEDAVPAIDLRGLNPPQAGDDGPIEARGEQLVSAKTGMAKRYWGVSISPEIGLMPDDALMAWAQRLARRGVNYVRIHVAPIYEESPGPRTRATQRVVGACARQGIAVSMNWYCSAVDRIPDDWPAGDGLRKGSMPIALHLFYSPFQERYRRWAKNLLTAPSPDGRPPLGRDPAVTVLELVDEDNFFWWSFDPGAYPEAVRIALERQFGAWCASRHGSAQAALAAWGSAHPPKDMPDQPTDGRLALYPASLLGGAAWMAAQRDQARAEDEMRFLVETQRAFYLGMHDFLRDECGWNGPLIGTNWKTVDERVLGPLDNYANGGCAVMARNAYFGGELERQRFFPWMVGDFYTDHSLLREPLQDITMQTQLEGHPQILTEGGWELPNRFRTEGPLVLACYASLQGITGLCPFTCEGDWDSCLHNPWPISEPTDLGQYPAASLIYRHGYIKEGPVVLRDALRLEDLFHLKGAAIGAPVRVDNIRAWDAGGAPTPVNALPGIDPLAFYVGRVVRAIGDDPGKPSMLPDLATRIDRVHSTVRSATGELTLRWDVGLLAIDAPCAQGAVGFLAAAGETRTQAARFAMKNEYGAVVLVSLDGMPLSTSSRMLLQVMTEERNHGWATEEVRHQFRKNEDAVLARRITSVGSTPIEVREVQGSVDLLRPDAPQLTVTALDFGLRVSHVVGHSDHIALEPATLAYLIQR